MGPKQHHQQQQAMFLEEEGATGGAVEESFQPMVDTATSQETSFSGQIRLLEPFQQFQRDKDTEEVKEKQKLSGLNLQIAQLQWTWRHPRRRQGACWRSKVCW